MEIEIEQEGLSTLSQQDIDLPEIQINKMRSLATNPGTFE